jgi:hypothetical protein
MDHESWTPDVIHTDEILTSNVDDYMYFGSIAFIKSRLINKMTSRNDLEVRSFWSDESVRTGN